MFDHPRADSVAPHKGCVNTMTGHSGPVYIARLDCTNGLFPSELLYIFVAQGDYCLSGGQDKTIRLWNISKPTSLQTYLGHAWEVFDIAIAHDNRTFASVGGDRSVFLWDVASGRILRKFNGHHQRVNCVDFGAESNVLASGGYDKTIRLWDCRSSTRFPLQIIDDAKDSIASLQIKNTQLIAGGVDGRVRIYDIRKGSMSEDNLGHPVICVRWSIDLKCYLASTLDSSVRLFDRESGEMLNEFNGHLNRQYKVHSCFVDGDRQVASGSEDGSIVFWDIMSANITQRFAGHAASVTSVNPHPKNPALLLSASLDGTLRVWSSSMC